MFVLILMIYKSGNDEPIKVNNTCIALLRLTALST